MKKFLFFIFSVFYFQFSFGQITLDQNQPNSIVQHLVENVLVNTSVTGIQVSNVTFSCGDTNQIGYFNNATNDIFMESGFFMSTGGSSQITSGGIASNSNCADDADLVAQLQMVNAQSLLTNNEIVIEFDFIASGTSVEFEYVFGSHEYPTYVCSQYNDIFGFFISGPGITGPFLNQAINMAKVPDPSNPTTYTNTPVIINTLNNGTVGGNGSLPNCNNIDPNWQSYSIFFNDNVGSATSSNINFGGYTKPLKAVAPTICGETYHLKLAIADVHDGILNSAVFLKEGSFNVVAGSSELESQLEGSDSILIEGCYPGQVIVKLDQFSQVADAEIFVEVEGTAQEGVDYQDIVDTLVIPAGDSVGAIDVVTIVDNQLELDETVIIRTFICDGILSEDTFVISDPDSIFIDLLSHDTLVCANSGNPIPVHAIGSGGYTPYNIEWFYKGNLEGTGENIILNPQDSGMHIVKITEDCNYEAFDTFYVNYIPPVPTASLSSFFDLETDKVVEGCEYGKLNIKLPRAFENDTTFAFQIVGGSAEEGVDFYQIPKSITFPAGVTEKFIQIEAIVDGIFETDEDIQFYFPFYDACTTEDNPLTVTIVSNPVLSTDMPDSVYACKGEQFTVDPEIYGGIEPYAVEWSKNGQGAWTSNNLTQTANASGMYYIKIKDACDYQVKDSIYIDVPEYVELSLTSEYASNITMCRKDDLTLSVDVEGGIGGISYTWLKDGIPVSTKKEYEISENKPNIYNFALVARDSCGNTESKNFIVKIEHCEVPNIFTPNGDGVNDAFKFESKDIETSISLSIFDRWGKSVFSSNNYETCNNDNLNCWEGTLPGTDKEAPEGVYFYVVKYEDERIIKGTFQLMR
ncbi:MAG: choice-of-anchor L domain-containing protein [Flavobacteriales bacterium]|jgi:gliding motility-associated-like protein|nr:choice-of-anchor L domain-containing protein [Flavobacteriales bacterium]